MSRERDTFDRFQAPDRGRFGDNEHAPIRGNDSVRSDLTDIDVPVHFKSAKALLVSLDGKQANVKWLPLSQIEFVWKGRIMVGERKDGQLADLEVATVTLPRWLARDKGLIT